MISYLFVIKDSFREAMASRVLWLVVLLITVLLIALLPFHWVETVGAKLDGTDIRNVRSLATELKRGEASSATPLQKRIWAGIAEQTRHELDEVIRESPERHRARAQQLLTNDLNRLIQQEDFFDPEVWREVKISSRLRELVDAPELGTQQRQHRNRLALEAALPGMLSHCPGESVLFRYAKWDISFLSAMSPARAEEQIDFVLMVALPLFVGFFGIFAAVLVTAPIIPNMLASGSLNLLLSKPIARPLLFVAKFLGGCSFVFINVSYLVVGVLLLLGTRFQIWKPELLWAIPIFLFSFAIFYSVSAVSALIWRNTVLSIGLTVVFWVACVIVGTTRGLLDQFVIVPNRIEQLVHADGELFVVRANGALGRWDPETRAIGEIMEVPSSQPAFIRTRPQYQSTVYDVDSDMLLALQGTWAESKIYAALRTNDWKRELPIRGPKNALAMFMRNHKPTIVTEGGVYAISMAQAEEPLPEINIFGFKIPSPTPMNSHERLSGPLTRLPASARAAFSSADDRIYLQSGSTLKVLSFVNDRFTETGSTDTELEEITHLAAGAGIVVVVNREASRDTLHVFHGSDLQAHATITPASDDDVQHISISTDGHWLALLTADDALSVVDLETTKPVWRAKAITAVQFQGDELWTADEHDRLVSRQFPEAAEKARLQTQLTLSKRFYRYLVNPLYLAFPKPKELENTIRYALTGKDTQRIGGPGFGPHGRIIKLDPWQPLYSNSAFIAVMLTLGGWYIHRQDF